MFCSCRQDKTRSVCRVVFSWMLSTLYAYMNLVFCLYNAYQNLMHFGVPRLSHFIHMPPLRNIQIIMININSWWAHLSSDERYKTDVTRYTTGINITLELKLHYYTLKHLHKITPGFNYIFTNRLMLASVIRCQQKPKSDHF